MKRSTLSVAAIAYILTMIGAADGVSATLRNISFDNNCNKALRLIIKHADIRNSWRASGWWEFSAMEGPKILAIDGRKISQLDDHEVYFYAETLDRSNIWEGTAANISIGSNNYGARAAKTSIVGGNLRIDITCS